MRNRKRPRRAKAMKNGRRITTVVLTEETYQDLRPVQADLALRGERPSVSAAIREAAREAAERRGPRPSVLKLGAVR